MTKIKDCKSCKPHDFQDKKYGDKKRVHNRGGSGDNIKWTCTVCNTQTTGSK